MQFFNKLLGSFPILNKKKGYARATLKHATNSHLNKRNAIACHNREFAFKSKGEYARPLSDYTRAIGVNSKKDVNVMNIRIDGLRHQKISITFYKSHTSQTYLSISRS
ncbi:MAG: hypothetical protein RQ760_19015 [Sedimentisphaerales bacterium]|nr:hypothetical protein [Sedimentisphaerales bacterium]